MGLLRMPVTSGIDRVPPLATPERSLAYVKAVQKKQDFVRKSAGPRSWCCLLLSQGAAMGCGVPYQHPVMGVLISRAVPRGTSLCFTAEQDNNHSPSPSLSYRGSMFLAGVSPGPWWGCKPGSGGH